MCVMSEVLEILSTQIGNTIQNNVSTVAHVKDVVDGVYGFYTNVYRHTVYCIHAHHPSKREGSFKLPHPVGLVVHHKAVWWGNFVNFLGLVKLQGWMQPIPNS